MVNFGFESQVNAIHDKEQTTFAKVTELERTLPMERARITELKKRVDAERHARQQGEELSDA